MLEIRPFSVCHTIATSALCCLYVLCGGFCYCSSYHWLHTIYQALLQVYKYVILLYSLYFTYLYFSPALLLYICLTMLILLLLQLLSGYLHHVHVPLITAYTAAYMYTTHKKLRILNILNFFV